MWLTRKWSALVRPGGRGRRGGEGRHVDSGRRWGSGPRERWAAERSAAGLSSRAPRGIHFARVHGKEVIRKRRRGGSPPEDGLSNPVARRLGLSKHHGPEVRVVRWGYWAERFMPRAGAPEAVRAEGKAQSPEVAHAGAAPVAPHRGRRPSPLMAAAPSSRRRSPPGRGHRPSPVAGGSGRPAIAVGPDRHPSRCRSASRPAIPTAIPLLAAPACRAQPRIHRFHWPLS